MHSLRAATPFSSLILSSLNRLGPAGSKLPAAAFYNSTPATAAEDPLGQASPDSRVEGTADDTRHGTGDTYYSTDKYPNTAPGSDGSDAAQARAMSASRSPHPTGPADTSSMNTAEGRGRETLSQEARDHVHHPGRPDFKDNLGQGSTRSYSSSSSTSSILPTFPRLFSTGRIMAASASDDGKTGRGAVDGESDGKSDGMFTGMQSMSGSMAQGMSDRGTRDGQQMSGGGPGSTHNTAGQGMPQQVEGMSQGSHAGAGSGSDQAVRSSQDRWSEPSPADAAEVKLPRSTLKGGTPTEGAEFDQVEGGRAGGIAGAWRATTADFAAGGDDMTGGGTAGTAVDDAAMNDSVNPETGLPTMTSPDDSKAHAAGFGTKRDPGNAKEEGGTHTARQTEKSSGQVPFDVSSS